MICCFTLGHQSRDRSPVRGDDDDDVASFEILSTKTEIEFE